MSLTIEEIRDYIVDNLGEYARFINFDRLPKVAEKIQSYGLGVMSKTLIARAVQDLALKPLYAKEDETTNRAEEAISQADTVPLTRELGNQLTQMTPQQVAEKFHSDPYFQRLYTRAAQLWGFKLPSSKPAQQAPGSSVTPVPLTAREYHSLPAAVVCRRLKEPAFRAAVELLISQGLIVLLFCIGVFK